MRPFGGPESRRRFNEHDLKIFNEHPQTFENLIIFGPKKPGWLLKLIPWYSKLYKDFVQDG